MPSSEQSFRSLRYSKGLNSLTIVQIDYHQRTVTENSPQSDHRFEHCRTTLHIVMDPDHHIEYDRARTESGRGLEGGDIDESS